MDNVMIAWSVAGLVGVLAVGLLVRVSSEGRRTGALRNDLEDHSKELRSLRRQLEQQGKAVKRSGSEGARLERKASQAEKRASQVRSVAKAERAESEARIEALEAAAADSSAELSTLRADLVQTEAARDGATRAEQAARKELLEAHEAQVSRSAADEPSPDPQAAAVPEPEGVDAAESAAVLAERDRALAALQTDLERLRAKGKTQDLLYVSIRSELAIKKEGLRQQREEIERLRAFKVAMSDEPDDEDPATSTASAD